MLGGSKDGSPLEAVQLHLNFRLATDNIWVKYVPNGAFPVAQWQRTCLPMPETQAQSLGQADPWERNGNPLRYSCLRNPIGQRKLASYSPWGRKRVRYNLAIRHNKYPQYCMGHTSAKKEKLFVFNLNSNLTRYLESLFVKSGNSQ